MGTGGEGRPAGGVVGGATYLEGELNRAGVVEGRMLSRLLDAAEVAGAACLHLKEHVETKWVVGTAVAAALLASGGEPEPVLVVAGALVNALLGKAAKRALSQPRPPGAAQTDHGMPSSHAMSLFFFGSTLAVGCLRAALLGSLLQAPHANDDAPPAWGVAVGCILWVLAAVMCLGGAAVLSW